MESQIAIKTSIFSIILNSALAILKFIAGILGNSYALIADAIESTSDIFSSILVWVGLKYSSKPPDENHPYGHGRFEVISTFAVIGFLVVSATIIAYESIIHIRTPHASPKIFTLYVLVGIIFFKELSYQYVKRKSRQTHSSSLEADAWHHRSDAITSLLAFIGISIAIFMGEGYESADDWAALIASGIIIYNAYRIFKPVLGEISDEQLYGELQEKIADVSKNFPGVVEVEKCHVRKMGMVFYIDMHLVVNGQLTVIEGHRIAHNLKDEIINQLPQIADVLIHVEPDRVSIH